VACGKVFSYDNVDGKRVVNEAEAAVVHEIFTLAETQGLLKIARAVGKHATSVRAILGNRIYVGEEIYGRTRAVDKGGTKIKEKVKHEKEWIRIPVPAIITQAQWQKVHARLAQTRLAHPGVRRDPKTGQLQGRVSLDTGLDSHHLLSGFLRCGSCGGNMKLSAISHKANKTWNGFYCGRYYQTGGSKLPGCRGSVPYDAITQAVRVALDPEVLQHEVLTYLGTIKLTDPDLERARLESEIKTTEREVDNLSRALQDGYSKALTERLRVAGARCESLHARLTNAQALADTGFRDQPTKHRRRATAGSGGGDPERGVREKCSPLSGCLHLP
jgi:recombinase/recombinase-like zinc beta ribbon protein